MAETSPQIVSFHGEPKVVVINIEEYRNLIHADGNIVSFFQNSPLKGIKLKVEGDASKIRITEL